MRKFFLIVTAAFISKFSFSQVQVGLFGGVSNYLGDLTDRLYQNTGPALGVTVGYPLTNRINLRAGFTYAKLGGADSTSLHPELVVRNLNFQSNISEFSLVAEVNTFDMTVKRWSPYIFGGLAVFHFNPYTHDQQNNKVFLQPLGTEGQGLAGYPQSKLYGLTQLAIPFGGGIKYDISNRVRLAAEIGLRKLFTDYLDDVSGNYADPIDLATNRGAEAVDLSYRGDEIRGGDPVYPEKGITRGSPKYKDWYYLTGLHLIFRFGGGDDSYRTRGGKDKRYGCPTVF